ncbi:MAG TPA: response regulator [Zoogloea sp.]|uniref:response regulator n=1 Tax=Zoogloea sp. TaxID=49181 RepID=UPI002C4C9066|nr:response regulator [Zoogloea sp.]HMV18448.1 response regulator [Rhodocyclaceae bacterium]HMV62273.1 response regulator [Rhodocyclaceae bacterium]HMW50750.1 response regulator [Rhodocyclaceae bacterium]HMY49991.1 response regulator [Rhodocyclaceae bacterium]HMZ75992.1 response regulator [Rhodocyclaceae bacterium]
MGTDPRPVVVVIEDEPKIRRFVCMALESADLQAFEADSVKRGLIEAGTRQADLVVLDLGLPDGDGKAFIRELRTWSAIPVIVLSARTQESEKVAALDAGADDYLVKPFGAAELLARVRAQLRRAAPRDGTPGVMSFGRLRADFGRRLIERDGVPVHLTPIEFRLLACLASHPDTVLTHRHLALTVWGPGHAEDVHYVRVHMAQLRKKIEDDPSRPRHLLTESGVGYRFCPR